MPALTPAEFNERFDGFTRSAFRLETLPYYVSAIEAEPFARWERGEPDDLVWRQPWRDRVGRALARGASMSRVHIVREPLSPYLRFQLDVAYPVSVAAGEDVRIVATRDHPAWSAPDFWLLDDEAFVMDYDQDGNWLGVDLVEDPAVAATYRTRRDHLLRDSIPLADYLGRESRRTA